MLEPYEEVVKARSCKVDASYCESLIDQSNVYCVEVHHESFSKGLRVPFMQGKSFFATTGMLDLYNICCGAVQRRGVGIKCGVWGLLWGIRKGLGI